MYPEEINLDPENWDNAKQVAHNMIDDMFDYLKTVDERPVWSPFPTKIKDQLDEPLPTSENLLSSVYDIFKKLILPYPMGNIHPRFWGWVIGNGTVSGALGEFLASVMNPNVGGGEHAGSVLEKVVIDWAKQMLGYDPNSSGLLTSGGSMANLIGLAVARNTNSGFDVRKEGLGGHKLAMYASTETHSSVQKAVELLGLGSQTLRKIPVDDSYQIKLDNLRTTIESDMEGGFKPFCLVGNLGTVNTGAVDDLKELSRIAKEYGLWFHVDGAFGAITKITPDYHYLANGLELGDSIAFDFHKWLYIPYEAGCVLVKNGIHHYNSFTLTPEYLTHGTRGVHGGDIWFSDYGVELSRGFKSLKIWMSLKLHGIKKYGQVVQQNIEQAKYLTGLIRGSENLELMAPTSMNIVCFRYIDDSIENLNAFNEEILLQLHERGIAVPSYTNINGKYCIRVAITNHRSRRSDFDFIIEKILDIAESIDRLEIIK